MIVIMPYSAKGCMYPDHHISTDHNYSPILTKFHMSVGLWCASAGYNKTSIDWKFCRGLEYKDRSEAYHFQWSSDNIKGVGEKYQTFH